MSSKPGYLCYLQKGKFVGGQSGFVDTFNWLVSWVSSIKTEDGEKLKGESDGSPIIPAQMKLKSGDDSNVVISEEKDEDGHYKIDVYYV